MSQHCSCRKFSLETATKVDAPPKYQARFFWACGNCGGLHHAVQEPVVMVYGPRDATALLNAYHESNGRRHLTWATQSRGKIQTVEFYPWPRRSPMDERTEPLILTTWNLLMSKVAVILGSVRIGETDDEIQASMQAARNEGRGIAEALAILMYPYMENSDTVVRHAVAQHKDPTHEVPGLGDFLWDPLRNADKSFRTMPNAEAKEKPRRAEPVLADDVKASITGALQSGMFTAKQLAEVYKVSEQTISALA